MRKNKHSKSTKRRCRRLARKRALKWVSNTLYDSMSAARRLWGQGEPK